MSIHNASPLSSTAYSGRSVRVDYLRGAFAIFVALGHLYDMARLNSDATGWLDVPRSLFGTNWVIGFVVISGFLIESSVEGMMKRGEGVARYVKARATRIAPLYYLGFAAALIVEYAGAVLFNPGTRPAYWLPGNWDTILGQLLLIQNVFIGLGTFGSFAATSTVAFEVWYYCLWTIRIRYFREQNLPLVFLGVVLLWPQLIATDWVLTNDVCLFWGYWLIGAYTWHYRYALLNQPIIRMMTRFGYLWIMIFMSCYLVVPATVLADYYWLLALLFALLLLKEEQPNPGVRNRRVAALLGDASYPIFIMHGPAGIFTAWALNASAVEDFYLRYGSLLCVTAAVSLMTVFLLERPLMRWRRQA